MCVLQALGVARPRQWQPTMEAYDELEEWRVRLLGVSCVDLAIQLFISHGLSTPSVILHFLSVCDPRDP